MNDDRTASGASSGLVVVTGASTGIGRAVSLDLASAGYNVLAGVRRDTDAERLSRESVGRVEPVLLDVARRDQIEALVNRIADAPLTGLINNAGIVVASPVETVPIDDLREQFDVNLFGAVAMMQALAEPLRQARGRIINISSVSGRIALPMLGPYAASKFALEAISDAARVEFAESGVHVVLVEPGAIATPIWDKSVAAAQRRFDAMSPTDRRRYQPRIEAVTEGARASAKKAVPVERVTAVVRRALSAPRPRARYLVGTDARLVTLVARFAPDRVRDALVRRAVRRVGRSG